MNHLKVVIIGAGIGGLTAGIAMRQIGYEVEIYDRVKQLRPAGAGISLWSNGVKVVNRLGLGDRIAKIGGVMNRMEYRSQQGEMLNDISLRSLIDAVGQRPYPVARRDLQQMLLDAFPGQVKLNCKCIGIEENGQSVTALFEDGYRASGDLLIAADGIRSVLRQHVLQEQVEPRYGGYVNWNGLVPINSDLAADDTWAIYVGDHKRVSLMPVGEGRFYFFFDVPLPVESAANVPDDLRAELAGYFAGWAQPVQTLIQRLDPATTNRLLIHDIGPIERMVRGRVALLGDSAHATCPDLGQGGCQAMEDALVLTNYLMTTNLGVEDALRRYEAERLERVSEIVIKARKRADQIHGKDPELTQQWYQQLREESPEAVTGAIAKTILGGPLH